MENDNLDPVVEQTEKVTTQEQQEVYRTFSTEEEFNKFVQSTSSKAKGSILKELNANSIDEINNKISSLEELQNKYNELETSKIAVADEFNSYKEEIRLTSQLGLKKEQINDFNALVNSKLTDGVERSDIEKEVIEAYFSPKVTKIGTEKSDTTPKSKTQAELYLENKTNGTYKVF